MIRLESNEAFSLAFCSYLDSKMASVGQRSVKRHLFGEFHYSGELKIDVWHDENHIGHCTKNDPLFFSFSAFYSTILSEPFPSYLFLHHRTDILFTIISLYMKSLVERIASRTQVCMMSSPKGTKNMYINSAEPQKREEISGKLLYLCPRS